MFRESSIEVHQFGKNLKFSLFQVNAGQNDRESERERERESVCVKERERAREKCVCVRECE